MADGAFVNVTVIAQQAIGQQIVFGLCRYPFSVRAVVAGFAQDKTVHLLAGRIEQVGITVKQVWICSKLFAVTIAAVRLCQPCLPSFGLGFSYAGHVAMAVVAVACDSCQIHLAPVTLGYRPRMATVTYRRNAAFGHLIRMKAVHGLGQRKHIRLARRTQSVIPVTLRAFIPLAVIEIFNKRRAPQFVVRGQNVPVGILYSVTDAAGHLIGEGTTTLAVSASNRPVLASNTCIRASW